MIGEDQIEKLLYKSMMRDWGFMAAITRAIYEKYGDEGLKVIKKAMYRKGASDAKRILREDKLDPKKLNLKDTINRVIAKSWAPISKSGHEVKLNKMTKDTCKVTTFRCIPLEAWLAEWKNPAAFPCETFTAPQHTGTLETVNRNFKYAVYCKVHGAKGLPAKAVCKELIVTKPRKI